MNTFSADWIRWDFSKKLIVQLKIIEYRIDASMYQ